MTIGNESGSKPTTVEANQDEAPDDNNRSSFTAVLEASDTLDQNKMNHDNEDEIIDHLESANSTLYSLDSATKELLQFSSENDDDDSSSSEPLSLVECCSQCDNQRSKDQEAPMIDEKIQEELDDFEELKRTFTISRLTYNMSEFDARFRRASGNILESFNKKNKMKTADQRKCFKSKTSSHHYRHSSKRSSCHEIVRKVENCVPMIGWLKKYQWNRDWQADFMAGITIAVFQIPQCMGYSLLANVPPIYGLYSSFLAPLFYAVLGTSKHISIGTFAIISLMTGSIVSDLSSASWFVKEQSEIEIASIIAFLIGFYQMIFALGQFGFLAQFMSAQLTSGFITASAFYVFSSQLNYLVGIDMKSSGSGAFALMEFYCGFFKKAMIDTNLITLSISLICIVFLSIYKFYILGLFTRSRYQSIRAMKNFPVELVLVVVWIIISWSTDLKAKYHVKILGDVPVGLPNLVNLKFSLIWKESLWLSCIPLAIIAFAVTYSTGVTFAEKHGYQVKANQELLALGVTNTVCAFFRCVPTAASLSRSALQESIGARSQMAAIVNSLCILIVLLFLSPLLSYLPICVLASIICVALKSLFMKAADFKKYYQLDRIDGSIWIVSFVAVLVFNVDLGLYIGLAYSLLTLIAKSQRPKTYLLGVIENTNVYVPVVHYPKARELSNIKIFQFCGPLHFANVEYFKVKLSEKTQIKIKSGPERRYSILPQAIIIDCSMFSYIDVSGISTLRMIVKSYEKLGIKVLLADVATHVAKMMAADGQFHLDVPTDKIYITVHDAVHVIQGGSQQPLNTEFNRKKETNKKIEAQGKKKQESPEIPYQNSQAGAIDFDDDARKPMIQVHKVKKKPPSTIQQKTKQTSLIESWSKMVENRHGRDSVLLFIDPNDPRQ